MSYNVILNNSSATKLMSEFKHKYKQYKPLSKSEEEQLINLLKDVDVDKLRELLVYHNIGWAFTYAAKYCKSTKDYDNLCGNAVYGLVKAAEKFDFDKKLENGESIKFITYAAWWVKKFVVAEFQGSEFEIEMNEAFSLDSIMYKNRSCDKDSSHQITTDSVDDLDVDTTATRLIPKRSDFVTKFELSELYDTIYTYVIQSNELSSQEKDIFIDQYYKTTKTRDTAKRLNTNIQYVINKKNRVLKKVRDFLKSKYNLNKLDDVMI